MSGFRPIGEIRKKVTKTYELISCSYHESGHAIYALLHAMNVAYITVFEDKKLKRVHGVTYYDHPREFDTIQDSSLLNALVKADIGMSYAGLIAEKALFKSISGSSQTPLFIIDGSAEDNRGASELIKKYSMAIPGQKRAIFKKNLMREVRNDLLKHWDAVAIIAHALFKHRNLDKKDIVLLLTTRSKNKKFWKEQFKKIEHHHNHNLSLDEQELKLLL